MSLIGFSLLLAGGPASGQVPLPDAKPVPRMQVVPLPDDQAAIECDGVELTRYHFGTGLRRPFLFPAIGPAGRSLTRMGHPHDPFTHSHHNSIWIAHESVNGDSFWDDRGAGRIVPQRILRYDDGDEAASILALNAWLGKGDRAHLLETRGMTVRRLPDRQWFLTLDLNLEAPKEPVVLGKTAFGMIGVRMAKTIGVRDGGGLIRNSEGNSNESGPDGVFHKRARWVDYSGPITNEAAEGITLFDHPSNPHHPCHFHVRDDGWMGASLTLEETITIPPGQPLRLRYGLWIHAGVPARSTIEEHWDAFSRADGPARSAR
jgi:hypothetical protein